MCDPLSPFDTLPRTRPNLYRPPTAQLIRKEWSIPISVFKDYTFDTPVSLRQELLDKCFEFDWAHTKIEKFVKNLSDLAELKEVIRTHYPKM